SSDLDLRQVDPEERAVHLIVSDHAAMHASRLDGGAILDVAGAHVDEPQAAHRDIVGGNAHELMRSIALHHRHAVAGDLHHAVHDDHGFTVDARVHNDVRAR